MQNFEEVIRDSELYELFWAQVAKMLGGFDNLVPYHWQPASPNRVVTEIRHSPVEGRYSITLMDWILYSTSRDPETGVWEGDEGVEYVKLQWYPDQGTIAMAIPWRAIKRWEQARDRRAAITAS